MCIYTYMTIYTYILTYIRTSDSALASTLSLSNNPAEVTPPSGWILVGFAHV